MTLPAALRHRGDALFGVAVGLLFVAEVVARSEDVLSLLAVVPLVVAVPWVRRRLPLVSMAACVAAWQLSDAVDPAFNEEGGLAWLVTWLVAHYALGRWTTGALAWTAPLVSAAAAVVLGWDDIAQSSGAGDLAYFLSVSLVPWGAGLGVRVRQERVAALTAENERLEHEQEEAARRAVAEERARIARELHDVVAHAIAVTVLQARGARRLLGKDDAAVRGALDAIEGTNAAALGDMRRLLAVLRDTEDRSSREGAADREPQPSLARIDRLIEEVRSAGLDVELTTDGEPGSIPPGVDLSAYRIVQEALTNVLKHAGRHATAAVRLVYGANDLSVTVRDRGGESPGGGGSGHGLIGIRERVAVVGGEVSAGPHAEGGFEINARLPFALELP